MSLIDQQNKLAQGLENIKSLKTELKEVRKQIHDACMQDKLYYERFLEIKDLRMLQSKNRDILVDSALIDKVGVLAERLKLEKLNLSDWMNEYVAETKLNTVSIQESLFEIVPSYSLKPRLWQS